jgi:hypothetical protein
MATEIEEYWNHKAEELGEPILFKSIAQGFGVDAVDRFGILFCTSSRIIFEYSKSRKRSLVDVLLSRRDKDNVEETLQILRNELVKVEIINANVAKQWVRRQLDPRDILALSNNRNPIKLIDLLVGTGLGLYTAERFVFFDSPANREWRRILSGE